MPENRLYTDNDLAIARISSDVGYIKDEIKNINVNITTGFTPLSIHNALADKVNLYVRLFGFLVATIFVAGVTYVFSLLHK